MGDQVAEAGESALGGAAAVGGAAAWRAAEWLVAGGRPKALAEAWRAGVLPASAETCRARLADLGLVPALLWPSSGARARDDAPEAVVFVAGRLPAALGVAVVGARATDPYGEAVARAVARDAVALDRAVVSGGAEGCDLAAHEAALDTGGQTVVVLAGGHDRPYPAAHQPLFEAVVAGGAGAVVSPFPPGTPPRPHRFLHRNRTIALVSAVTVVARARARSGALTTARQARALGRPVLAAPGDVGEGLSVGGHVLVARGDATLVLGPRQLARALGLTAWRGVAPWPVRHLGTPDPFGVTRDPSLIGWEPGSKEAWRRALADDPTGRAVMDALGGGDVLDLDDLVRHTGLGPSQLVASLVDLEMAGLIARRPGARWRTTSAR